MAVRRSRAKAAPAALPAWTSEVDLNGLWVLQNLAADCVQTVRRPSIADLRRMSGLMGGVESEEVFKVRESLRKSTAADIFLKALQVNRTHQALLADKHYASLIDCIKKPADDAHHESLRRHEALACLIQAVARIAMSFLIDAEAISSQYRLTPTRKALDDARKLATALLELRRLGLYAVPEFVDVRKALEGFLAALPLAEPGARGKQRANRATPDQHKLLAAQGFQAALSAEFPDARAFRTAALNRFCAFLGYPNPYAVSP